MSSDLKHLVFAYGTLKRGEPNFKWLTEEAEGKFKVLAAGKTTKKRALVIGSRYNVPYLLDHSGKMFRSWVSNEARLITDFKSNQMDFIITASILLQLYNSTLPKRWFKRYTV
jgi:hypothetical protein